MSAAGLAAALAGACLALALADVVTALRARRRKQVEWSICHGYGGESTTRRRGRATALAALAGAVARRLRLPGPPRDLPGRLAAAGRPARFGPPEAMAVKWVLAVAGALVALVAGPALPGRLGLLSLVAGPTAGFVALDALLVRRARQRAAAARREVADVCDRIRLACDAGFSPARALERAARDGDGPVAAELRALAAAVALGATLDAGLDQMTGRLPVPEVRALAAAARRAARHGAPLGPAAADLAASARAGAGRRLRDRSQRAAPQIQLVVALLLVPSALLLVAAGLLAGLR